MKFLNDYFKYENGLTIGGLTKELNIFYVLELFKNSNKNIVLLTNTLYEANMYYDGISTYYDKVGLFPMDDFLTSVAVAISPDLKVKRLETLESIRNNKKSLIVTNLMGYLRYLPNKGNISNLEYVISKSDSIKRQDILEILDTYNVKTTFFVGGTWVEKEQEKAAAWMEQFVKSQSHRAVSQKKF